MEELFTTPRSTLENIFERTKPENIVLQNVKKGNQEWDGYCGFRAAEGYQKLKCLKCGYTWTEAAGTYKHKDSCVCGNCEKRMTILNLKKYRSTLESHENIVVITAENPESVWVECLRMSFTLPVRFGIEETETRYDTARRALFHLTPGKAKKWKASYSLMFGNGSYLPVKKVEGFKFIVGQYGREEAAMLFGEENLGGTFLKYANPKNFEDYTASAWNITEYLVNFARYPVWTEFLERMQGIMSTAPMCKDRRIKYRSAKSVAELFPKLNKEKRRIFTRLLQKQKGDVMAVYETVEKYPPELIRRVESLVTVREIPTLLEICKKTKRKPEKIGSYLKKQDAGIRIYGDYLGECTALGYDLSDEMVLFPKNLIEKHAETSELCQYRATQEVNEKAKKRAERLMKEGAEYRHGRLMVRVPRDGNEIISEGAKLSHCVGGYVERHASGKTTILFIRKRNDPETPYFTLEIDTKSGAIKQCYGYKNRQSYRDNLEVGQLLEHYQRHLEYIKSKKQIKKGRKTA